MIQEVWILVKYNLYESKRYFCKKLAEAFKRKGVQARVLDFEKDNPKEWFKERNNRHLPDYCCSFNRSIPNEKGQFFWDLHRIPYHSILVDPAYADVNLIQSPYSIISCVDRMECSFLHEAGFQDAFFSPHAVERELSAKPDQERPFDVVFFGSSCDPDGLRAAWQAKYPQAFGKIIDDASEMTLSQRNVPFWKAVKMSILANGFTEDHFDINKLYYFVDNYTRGVDRLQLIRSIKEARVHVFGATCWRDEMPIRGWMQCLGSQANVTIHPAIPFQESLEILKQSKICLNSMPFFKDGTHERIFTGLACGALPITNDNRWVSENFIDGEELVLFRSSQWDEANDKVNHLLSNAPLREKIVAQGRAKVMRNHTWDQRVEQLLTAIPPLLERMPR